LCWRSSPAPRPCLVCCGSSHGKDSAFARLRKRPPKRSSRSAFSGDAAIVRDEELKGIEEALRGFRDALAAQDPEAINQLFDLRRFVDEVVSTGLLKFRPSEMDDAVRGAGVALSTALAKNHSLYGFARFEIKKCTFNEDRDEAIAYVRISNSDGVAAKFRYWFSYHDNQWRLFDLEDLAGGMRLSSGAATIGAEIHPRITLVFWRLPRLFLKSRGP
jgi:hypothetical protein